MIIYHNFCICQVDPDIFLHRRSIRSQECDLWHAQLTLHNFEMILILRSYKQIFRAEWPLRLDWPPKQIWQNYFNIDSFKCIIVMSSLLKILTKISEKFAAEVSIMRMLNFGFTKWNIFINNMSSCFKFIEERLFCWIFWELFSHCHEVLSLLTNCPDF